VTLVGWASRLLDYTLQRKFDKPHKRVVGMSLVYQLPNSD
jgi:hypothetical protein